MYPRAVQAATPALVKRRGRCALHATLTRSALTGSPRVTAKPMPSSLDLRTLAALITASVAVAIVVAGEPAALAGAALLLAGALAVSLAWRH